MSNIRNYLDNKISDIYEELGIKPNNNLDSENNTIKNLSESVLNHLIFDLKCTLSGSTKVKIRNIDDNIVEVNSVDDIIAHYLLSAKLNDNKHDYSDILLYTPYKFYYHDGIHYCRIPKDVFCYLTNHRVPEEVWTILEFESNLSKLGPSGNTREVLKNWIKNYGKIRAKKALLDDELADKLNISKDNYLFELRFVENSINNGVTVSDLESWRDTTYSKKFHRTDKPEYICRNFDISYYDFLYRLREGSSIENAIKLGVKDRVEKDLCFFDIEGKIGVAPIQINGINHTYREYSYAKIINAQSFKNPDGNSKNTRVKINGNYHECDIDSEDCKKFEEEPNKRIVNGKKYKKFSYLILSIIRELIEEEKEAEKKKEEVNIN